MGGSYMAGDSFNFDKLLCRYIIKGKLVNLQQFHIGGAGDGGLKDSLVDNGFIRIYRGEQLIPYIPGSSLKGVFRSFLERIARVRGDKVCDPLDHQTNCQNSEDICVICAIFGSQQIASHLLISDAYPGSYKMSPKPGVAINRVTGAAQRGALYNFETINPLSEFDFEMIIENINLKGSSSEAVYIRFLLDELIKGNLKIGGKTSAGLGSIQLKKTDLDVSYITDEMIRKLELKYVPCKLNELISDVNDRP